MAEDIVTATFRVLGVEDPVPGVLLPHVVAEIAHRAKHYQARYAAARAALDGMTAESRADTGEVHRRLDTVTALIRRRAHDVACMIDNGELSSDQEHFARGQEVALLSAAELLAEAFAPRADSAQEVIDDPQTPALHQEAVRDDGAGEGGTAPDVSGSAGVHAVPVRSAQEDDVSPVEEAPAPVGTCWVCGKSGIQYQCEETPEPIADILAELKRANASGAVVTHRPGESLDDTVAEMIEAGWVLGETVHVGGKRIRYLTPPAPPMQGPYPKPSGWCDRCDADMSDENHYHCQRCGGRTSMMGHGDACPREVS